jgi:hypothetical protein
MLDISKLEKIRDTNIFSTDTTKRRLKKSSKSFSKADTLLTTKINLIAPHNTYLIF